MLKREVPLVQRGGTVGPMLGIMQPILQTPLLAHDTIYVGVDFQATIIMRGDKGGGAEAISKQSQVIVQGEQHSIRGRQQKPLTEDIMPARVVMEMQRHHLEQNTETHERHQEMRRKSVQIAWAASGGTEGQ